MAYAITAHKSQGSEFENTIVIIPKCSSFFMRREMLYTIFTRHKKNITIIVETDDIDNATDEDLKKYLLKFSDTKYSDIAFRLTNLFNDIPDFIKSDKFKWYDSNKVHITEREEMVRSKSEVIIANYLYQKEKQCKIKYYYEKEYMSKDGEKKLPDFTIEKGDKIYLLEHLGMLNDKKYKENWDKKKKWYESNGIKEYDANNDDKIQLIITKDENGALQEDIYKKLDSILN